jgi:hypothetical protein
VSAQDPRGRRDEPAFRGVDDGRRHGEVGHLPPYEPADAAPDTDGQTTVAVPASTCRGLARYYFLMVYKLFLFFIYV